MIFKKTKKIYILCYHSVANSSYLHSVPIDMFELQMKFIKKNFTPLSYQDFSEVMKGNRTLTKDAVVVTFDDGVQDNYTNAFPLLKKYNVPAIIFVSTDHVGKIHGGRRGYKFQFLRWDEMKEMLDSGLVSIQNHTHTHPLLTEIDTESIKQEVSTSNSLIEENLSHICTAIAYPKGDFDDAVIKAIGGEFRYGFTINGGYFDLKNKKPYQVPRILISQEVHMFKFKLLLNQYFWHLRNAYYALKRK